MRDWVAHKRLLARSFVWLASQTPAPPQAALQYRADEHDRRGGATRGRPRSPIPSWWKKTAKEVPSTFNARAETVASKPMFRAAFKRSRCLIPASGYYEWKPTPGGKQPYYISAADGSVVSMAGLWDQWTDIDTGARVRSCTIIVTAANALTRTIHNRMPVLIEPKDFRPWLNGEAGPELLRPAPDDTMRLWPVSKRVNRTGNFDDSTLIEKVSLDDA
jgi:putative SOS response-associated peptidase YedK